ncbi:MAG TPA: sulfurtransferase TusA family protein [Caulobacteraceae bacterium]
MRRTVEAAPPGSVVRLIADDPLARIDVPHFAAERGLELLEIRVDGAVLSVRIRTPKTGKRRVEGGDDAPPEDLAPS